MIIQARRSTPAAYRGDSLVLFMFEKEKLTGEDADLDRASGGMAARAVRSGDFEGKAGQVAFLYPEKGFAAGRIILSGLGERKRFDSGAWRRALADTARRLRGTGIREFAFAMNHCRPADNFEAMVEAAVEGILLGMYRFTAYKTEDNSGAAAPTKAVLLDPSMARIREARRAIARAKVVSDAVCLARELACRPANDMTPRKMADVARRIAAKEAVRTRILHPAGMKKLGMNAILSVAGGSHEPARLITMEYNGRGKSREKIVLIGKGITFDSGGICIKNPDRMDEMKSDMSGGAAVIGAINAAARLKLPVNVVGLVPAMENLPGGGASRPGDIVKSMSGRTIEIVNTDAEGRLALADALTYAARFRPAAVIDIATLTGACVVALGDRVAGMMGNDAELKKRISSAAEKSGERVWELPLEEEYLEKLKSECADIKNSGGREGGAVTAAAFLGRFADSYPWVHLDIAGPAWADSEYGFVSKGPTGFGVLLLVRFLRDWAELPHGERS
ncbi:MAG: leucyl aminopeptidase [Syntrophales bacterium]|nr:leucyl aminopeptidase [Syntrophales bacterium]